MSTLVAKRYVKALMGRVDTVEIYTELAQISTAYASSKFLSIIESTHVRSSAKIGLILSFVQKSNTVLTNIINLLEENKRLNIIPDIASEMEKELAHINNKYTGIIYTNNNISDEIISDLEKAFSKKLNTSLTLIQHNCDYNGIKVDIDGLGIEIAFSKERLKSQMINHILKAV
jgi:F-type H+-transporting ATPase subunit delta